jgi:hypothetical protein
MYLDGKRIAIALVCLVASLLAWWMVNLRNSSMEEQIRYMETGVAGPKQAEQMVEDFEVACTTARRLLKEGEYLESSLTLYRAYPKFEVLLRSGIEMEVEPYGSLQDFFDAQVSLFNQEMKPAYARIHSGLVNGSLNSDTIHKFFQHLPFSMGNEWKQKYKNQLPVIKEERLIEAPHWVIINILASMGGEEPVEAVIHEQIQKKWNPDLPYKLVFGRPLTTEEERAAAKAFRFYVETKYARYVEVGETNPLVGRDVLESITLQIIDRSQTGNAPMMNWQDLPSITVASPPPETITFNLERENQPLDFDTVTARQIEELAALLREAMKEQFPKAAFLPDPES